MPSHQVHQSQARWTDGGRSYRRTICTERLLGHPCPCGSPCHLRGGLGMPNSSRLGLCRGDRCSAGMENRVGEPLPSNCRSCSRGSGVDTKQEAARIQRRAKTPLFFRSLHIPMTILGAALPAVLSPHFASGQAAPAQQVVIDFEDLTTTGPGQGGQLVVDRQYGRLGVSFNSPKVLDYARGCPCPALPTPVRRRSSSVTRRSSARDPSKLPFPVPGHLSEPGLDTAVQFDRGAR